MIHPTQDRAFRLPLHVRPVRHDARLAIDLESRTFSGELRLDLELARPVTEVVLHAADLELTRAVLTAGGRAHRAAVRLEPESETAILTLPAEVPAGPATLELAWRGAFCDGLRGLYLAGPGLAATQFEAADARRVFPCLDEPGFKAPWRLAVEAAAGLAVLSNGARERLEELGATQRHHFAETPPLPTYLVALVVGRLDGGPSAQARGVPVRTWAVPERVGLGAFGQEVAMEVLPRLTDYFGLPYAFGKLDQVGLPDFEAGAMENAGLVTYREVALLLDPATASLAQRKRVAEVVTHELAHQWFGNLVTMTWWDDLWLNEAFATWMAYLVVDQWRPDWRVWLEFDQGKAAAMGLDALRSTHPIHAEVRTVAEATEAFDLITYEKGGAVLRMLEGYLGAGTFRDGIRRYMRRHARGNAVADDLWRALGEASGQPVLALAKAWIGRPGFPLVEASLAGVTLRLAQRRFFSRPGDQDPGARWPVPVVLRYGVDGQVRERRLLLEEETAEVALEGAPDWLVVNGGATGVYRVAPDQGLRAGLRRHLPALGAAERVGLLSDEWALVRCGARPVEAWLDLAAACGGETDHAVLDELVARLSALDHRLVAEPDRVRFQAFVAGLLGEALGRIGWEPAPGEGDEPRLTRAALVRAVGLVARDPATAAEAAARLDRFTGGERSALEANLQDAAVAMAARAGDAARFERFQALFRAEQEPAFRRRWLLALASFEDGPLAARAIDLALGDGVPLQDWASFAAGLLANRTARDPFWARLRTEWPAVSARLANAPMLFRRVVEAVGALPERRHLEEARAFFAETPVEAARSALDQTLERLAEEVALRERCSGAIGAWLAGRGGR
ncbi:MAG: M1 family metallopeptidase [Anaeromyxobacter sp.]|nr:M1 family metallopeptidase [Anaeromyxobacter sp.]MBL0276214.1 M1 family metallopeptidase [Anaeromyxobacter sp.]